MNSELFESISKSTYEEWRYVRMGQGNGERMDNPLWIAAVKNMMDAWSIGEYFEPNGEIGDRPRWCFKRHGASCNKLESWDNFPSFVWIGGEHEDSYAPDFCIYNDVVVTQLDGTVEIYGYAPEIFPPTDFHTATLVGDSALYVIGRLGYHKDRIIGTTPVFRLDLEDKSIHKISILGEEPSWLHKHEAIWLPGQKAIVVWGGDVFTDAKTTVPNDQSWMLKLDELRWSRIDQINVADLNK